MYPTFQYACEWGVAGVNFVAGYLSGTAQKPTFKPEELHDPHVTAARIAQLILKGERIKFHIVNNDIQFDSHYVNINGTDPIQAFWRMKEGASHKDVITKGIYNCSTAMMELYPVPTKASAYIAALLKIKALGIYWHYLTYDDNPLLLLPIKSCFQLIKEYTEAAQNHFLPTETIPDSIKEIKEYIDAANQQLGCCLPLDQLEKPGHATILKATEEAVLFWDKIKDKYPNGTDQYPQVDDFNRELCTSWSHEELRTLVNNVYNCFRKNSTVMDAQSTLDKQLERRVKIFKKTIETIQARQFIKSPKPQLSLPVPGTPPTAATYEPLMDWGSNMPNGQQLIKE